MGTARHLKPRYGYLEQVEIDMKPYCDDGTLEPHPLVDWYNYLTDATYRTSREIKYQENTVQMLRDRGFVDITDTVVILPLNAWPADTHLKTVGRWYNLGLCEGLEALSLAPFSRVYNWPVQDIRRLVAEVKAAVCNKRMHVYHKM